MPPHTTNITIFMINVLYSSLDVSFCFMFPQTKYEYVLLLLRQNYSLFYLPIYITLLSYVFYCMFSNLHCISYIHREGSLLGEYTIVISLSPEIWEHVFAPSPLTNLGHDPVAYLHVLLT